MKDIYLLIANLWIIGSFLAETKESIWMIIMGTFWLLLYGLDTYLEYKENGTEVYRKYG